MLNIKNVIGATVVAFAGLSSVSAAPVSNLSAWAEDAAQVIDDNMSYPSLAARHGHEGKAVIRVTVDREGDVLRYKVTNGTKSNLLRAAALKLVQKVDFPDLPSDYDFDDMTFALELNYGIASSPFESRKLKRKSGTVTSEQVAISFQKAPSAIDKGLGQ